MTHNPVIGQAHSEHDEPSPDGPWLCRRNVSSKARRRHQSSWHQGIYTLCLLQSDLLILMLAAHGRVGHLWVTLKSLFLDVAISEVAS